MLSVPPHPVEAFDLPELVYTKAPGTGADMRWQSRALSRSNSPRRPDKLLSDDRAAARCHLSPRCLRKPAGPLAQGSAAHDRPDGCVDDRTWHRGRLPSSGTRYTGPSTERSVRRVGPEGKEGPSLCSDEPVDDDTGTLLEFVRRGPCELPKDPVLVQACTDGLVQVALSLSDRTPGRALMKARSTLGVVADIIRALRYEILLIRQMVHDLNTRSRMRRGSSGRSNRRRARQGNWKSQGRCGGEHTSHHHRLQGERAPSSGCPSRTPVASQEPEGAVRRERQNSLRSSAVDKPL